MRSCARSRSTRGDPGPVGDVERASLTGRVSRRLSQSLEPAYRPAGWDRPKASTEYALAQFADQSGLDVRFLDVDEVEGGSVPHHQVLDRWRAAAALK
jgi:hypothetical protein